MYLHINTSLFGKTSLLVCIAAVVLGAILRESKSEVREKSGYVSLALIVILLIDALRAYRWDVAELFWSECLRLALLCSAVHGAAAYVYLILIWLKRFLIDPGRNYLKQKRRLKRFALDQEAERIRREAAAANQLRRDDARKDCLLTYHRYAREVADALSWEQFNEYLATYMNDNLSPDTVDMRGQDLRETILSFAGIHPVKNGDSMGSLTEIAATFEKRREEVRHLSSNETTREAILANLAMEEARAIRKFQSR